MARPDPVAASPALPTAALSAAAAGPSLEMVDRLATQLNVLSELLETITYRLLELEERVATQDLRLQAIVEQLPDPAASVAGISDDAELRLEDTEERLSQLEALLNGMASPAGAVSARHLQSVPPSSSVPSSSGGADAAALEDPFPEEGEQPFMDELEADLQLDPAIDDSLSA